MSPNSQVKRRRILVVDDHPSVRETLEYVLGSYGYDALSAGDGKAGLELAEKENIDLIVLDLDLPVLDGFQVLERLSASDALRAIPVIVITGKFFTNTLKAAVTAGARDGLIKPFDFSLLSSKIAACLQPGGR
jgi:DNA-binding response OmpR family regulator